MRESWSLDKHCSENPSTITSTRIVRSQSWSKSPNRNRNQWLAIMGGIKENLRYIQKQKKNRSTERRYTLLFTNIAGKNFMLVLLFWWGKISSTLKCSRTKSLTKKFVLSFQIARCRLILKAIKHFCSFYICLRYPQQTKNEHFFH